ncbi:MAG: hypothetical protein L3J65_06350 [Robiginitomaculum sp.]|nr:hypothetical protein [Robiginitomaculum sp.]
MLTIPPTANDNTPFTHMKAGYSGMRRQALPTKALAGGMIYVSKYSPVKPGIHIEKVNVPQAVDAQLTQRKRNKPLKTRRFPVYIALMLWVLAVASLARLAGSPSEGLLVGSGLAMAGGGLAILSLILAALARRRGAKISHSIGIAGACVSICALSWFYMAQLLPLLPLEIWVMGLATTSLIMAKLWRTPFLLHLSLLLSIGWSAYSFINTQVSELAWLFPALWSLQMFFALEFRIKRSIALCIFAGLLWIGVNGVLLT